jgi:hypothetical protein
MPTRTPSNGLETANQKQKSQPNFLAVGFVFTLCSQAFEDRHFTEREVFSANAFGAVDNYCAINVRLRLRL